MILFTRMFTLMGFLFVFGCLMSFLAYAEFNNKGMVSWLTMLACAFPLITLPFLVRRAMQEKPSGAGAVVACHVCEGRGAVRCKACNGIGDCTVCNNRRFNRCISCDGTGVEAKI